MKNFAERLKLLRMKRGLSISQVAKGVGVSPSTYREWEYGREIKGFPYQNLARELNVSLTFLMTGEDKGKSAEHLDQLEKTLFQALECIKNIRQGL